MKAAARPTTSVTDSLRQRLTWLLAQWWLPFVPAALLMLWGYLRLQASAPSAAGSLYLNAATTNLAWSDIISIYGRDYMAHHPFPFTPTGSFEYPVLTGLLYYLAGFAGYVPDATPAFTVNYILLALSAFGLLWLIINYPGANPWLFAFSPALVLYTGANWDLLALLPGIAALLLYQQRRDYWATLLLVLSIWLKFFAILWLPFVLVERVRRRDWFACARVLGTTAVLSLLINLPFALHDAKDWGMFFTFNRERSIEVNFWTIIRDWKLPIDSGPNLGTSVDTVNVLSGLAVVLGVLALCVVQWRRDRDLTLPCAAIAITWFFITNKVYSPQYYIWLVPFMALLAAPVALFVALSFVDVIYYTSSFQILHFNCPGCDPAVQTLSNWDFDKVLMSSMELRELAFMALIIWIAYTYLRPDPALGRPRLRPVD
jgi:uncharacterized membrane protein